MALRLLRFVNKWFALAAFWTYLAAAAVAFCMVIVFFPVGALALLFAALLTLPFVVAFSTGLGWWERAWSRRWLRSARCPRCLAGDVVRAVTDPQPQVADGQERWRRSPPPSYECLRCGAFFDASGAEAEAPLAA